MFFLLLYPLSYSYYRCSDAHSRNSLQEAFIDTPSLLHLHSRSLEPYSHHYRHNSQERPEIESYDIRIPSHTTCRTRLPSLSYSYQETLCSRPPPDCAGGFRKPRPVYKPRPAMSLQTAGQASQAQPKTFTLDSMATASPVSSASGAYYPAYNASDAPPIGGYPQPLYPGDNHARDISSVSASASDSYYVATAPGKPHFNPSADGPPSAPHSVADSNLQEQRVRTNSMGQV